MKKHYLFIVMSALFLVSCASLKTTKVINSFYRNPTAAKKFGIQTNETQSDTLAVQQHERIWNRTHADVLSALESVSQKDPIKHSTDKQTNQED